jgi:predicted nucleic acid-binding protein
VIYVLDACAIIAIHNNESGAEIVRDLFEKAESGAVTLYMSPVNVTEVYYDRIYKVGAEKANVILQDMYSSSINIFEVIPAAVVREAGRFKTTYPLSLADAFACATASWLSATLVTSDHNELKPVSEHEPISFLWLPAHPKIQRTVISDQ